MAAPTHEFNFRLSQDDASWPPAFTVALLSVGTQPSLIQLNKRSNPKKQTINYQSPYQIEFWKKMAIPIMNLIINWTDKQSSRGIVLHKLMVERNPLNPAGIANEQNQHKTRFNQTVCCGKLQGSAITLLAATPPQAWTISIPTFTLSLKCHKCPAWLVMRGHLKQPDWITADPFMSLWPCVLMYTSLAGNVNLI